MSSGIKKSNLILLFVISAVLLRFLPHPWNVTPLTALALFAGTYLRARHGIMILLAALFLSDLILGFHQLIPLTWGCFLLIILIGQKIRTERFSWAIIPAAISGSVLFYVVTNLGVFIWGGLYPHSWQGLVDCYVMAIPFFRNALMGDVVYTLSLFGVFHLSCRRLQLARPAYAKN